MKNIFWLQLLTVSVYFLGFLIAIGLIFVIPWLFGISCPMWIPALSVLLGVLASAGIRIHVWKNRQKLFSEESLGHFGTKMFFALIPIELTFFVIGVGFIFS